MINRSEDDQVHAMLLYFLLLAHGAGRQPMSAHFNRSNTQNAGYKLEAAPRLNPPGIWLLRSPESESYHLKPQLSS
jgi:hypothetical protein